MEKQYVYAVMLHDADQYGWDGKAIECYATEEEAMKVMQDLNRKEANKVELDDNGNAILDDDFDVDELEYAGARWYEVEAIPIKTINEGE